jgi:hypothetical protein
MTLLNAILEFDQALDTDETRGSLLSPFIKSPEIIGHK